MLTLLLVVIYLAFISLGLPDSILGSAWPSMYQGIGVSLSSVGIISAIISIGTIISSLLSEKLIRRLGTGLVTLISVGMTAAALLGTSLSGSFGMLCLWAIPYGLGAGSVDSALNNFVALHYSSRHMSWLHCFWGLGATAGPMILGACLTRGLGWRAGYNYISMIQIALCAVLAFSLPLWKKTAAQEREGLSGDSSGSASGSVLAVRGVKAALVSFFCYCSVEASTGLWASSYMVTYRGINEAVAAKYASLFDLGITAGRLLSGFIAEKLGDKRMVRLGQALVVAGALLLLMPLGELVMVISLVMVGLGCAPIYPSLLHATPAHFGRERSQALMGLQMACAYTGTTVMPPLFGVLASAVGTRWLPVYLLVITALMVFMSEKTERVCAAKA